MNFTVVQVQKLKRKVICLTVGLTILVQLSGFGFVQPAVQGRRSQGNQDVQQQPQDPRLEEAKKLQGQARTLSQSGRYAEAIPLERKVIELQEQVLGRDHLDVAVSLNNLALLLYEHGDYAAAPPLLERALMIGEKSYGRPDDPRLAGLLVNLALLLKTREDYAAARALLERALRIRVNALGSDDPRVAKLLNNLALLLSEHGDYAAARPLLERAVTLLEKAPGPDDLDLAASLDNEGLLLVAQGDYAVAGPLLLRALKIREKAPSRGPDHPDVALSLSNLALLLRTQGDYAAARPLLERASKIAEKSLGRDHPHVASLLNELASLLRTKGDYAAARPLYERALTLFEKALGPDHTAVAITLNNLGLLLYEQGDYAAARPLLERALRMIEKTRGPDHPHVASVLDNLALLYWQQQDLPHAKETQLRAGKIVSTQTQRILPTLSFAEQRAFLKAQVPSQISLLLSLSREGLSLQDAYGLVFAWKGLLINSLHQKTAISRLAEDSKYKPRVERLQSIRAQVAGWYHKAGSVPFEQWKQKNDSLTQEKEILERELAQAAEPGALEDPLRNMNLQSFRLLLTNDEALFDVYLYSYYDKGKFVEDRYAAVMISPTSGPSLIDLGSSKAINRAVAEWKSAVIDDRESGSSEWQALTALIWKPLSLVLPKGVHKVLISPDGELARIPWQLFPRTDVATKDVLVCQTDSPRELVSLRRRTQVEIAANQRSLLLVGGIDFNAGAKVKGGQEDQSQFRNLPGALSEVLALDELAKSKKLRVLKLIEAEASKTAVREKLPAASYAHLATHGFFSSERELSRPSQEIVMRGGEGDFVGIKNVRNPLVESGIALAGANVRDATTMEATGLLTAEELVGLDLSRCELVTLSACDTGKGEQVTGQGVMGLRASMIAAGARSVVMSLWKVPDEATLKLMKAFYTNLWEKRLPKAEALLRAQETVRDDPSGKFKLPINWAGWILAGEGW